MFASQVKKTVEIGERSYQIRMLSWKSLDKAKDARQMSGAAHLRALGGEIMKALRSDNVDEMAKAVAEKDATPEGRAKLRYDAYDRELVLNAGVTQIEGELATPATVADIDPTTADRLYREILDLSLGPIDPAEAEAAQGKS